MRMNMNINVGGMFWALRRTYTVQWSFFGQKTPFARCKKSIIALPPVRVDVVPDWTLMSLFVYLKYSD